VVDITGHLAFGLLFALPAWYVLDDRASVGFVALAAVGALLPDIDLWLEILFPAAVHHHGVTHTVLFAVGASLVGGVVVAGSLRRRVDDWIGGESIGRRSLFVVAAVAVLAGTLSHVFADVLSAPDISTPIEPFWPFFALPWAIDLVWYDAVWINYGFFAVMVVAHVVAAYVTTPAARRHRLRPL